MSDLSRTLFHVEVRETDKNRNYWATRSWVASDSPQVRNADIVLLPWENFRDGHPILFPQGTPDFLREIKENTNLKIAIAVDRENYEEISLHGRALRWPTILVSSVILPIVIGVITNRIDEFISKGIDLGSTDQIEDTIEMGLIIEGEHGRCISIMYKGPPSRLVETLVAESARCLPPKKESNRALKKGRVARKQ